MRMVIALWAAIGFTAVMSAAGIVLIVIDQHHQNDALHSIICYADHAVRIRPNIPPAQRRAAIEFYDHALSNANLAPCK